MTEPQILVIIAYMCTSARAHAYMHNQTSHAQSRIQITFDRNLIELDICLVEIELNRNTRACPQEEAVVMAYWIVTIHHARYCISMHISKILQSLPTKYINIE